MISQTSGAFHKLWKSFCKFGKPFRKLGKWFCNVGKSLNDLGKLFCKVGKLSTNLRNHFPILGKHSADLGNRFKNLWNDKSILGNHFLILGNGRSMHGITLIALIEEIHCSRAGVNVHSQAVFGFNFFCLTGMASAIPNRMAGRFLMVKSCPSSTMQHFFAPG